MHKACDPHVSHAARRDGTRRPARHGAAVWKEKDRRVQLRCE
jgi:hypothetical protein